ncbi:MAG: HipA domain-containing protein [Polaromonas sp.]|uniref:type II toxin-antitoxin system HipA family toxin n=1 Tax=Polaromonas sp. TaxID=1869339 RepID=UPI0025D0F2C6|nr:HipA domain-containing protein [Polaromonas sp.]MBI2727662.1 HipA domain-containing protein [Polaromonas sp.]
MASPKNIQQARAAIEIHLDAPELGKAIQIGTLYPNDARINLAPSFEYTADWLGNARRFLLDPRLDLYGGEQHAAQTRGFGIFLDSAPHRWGRVLMERREASQARKEGRTMRHLNDLDFMLGVHDFTRTGALRYRAGPDAPFMDDHPLPAPPLTDLRELAAIAQKLDAPGVEELPEYEQWLAMLIAPGSSLGGARPKASYTAADGTLWLAKFPAHNDRYDWGSWEYLTHQLAREAGIHVPASSRLALSDRYHTFCVQRFDRNVNGNPQARRMYASAMTLLERTDGDPGASYLDLVEVLETQGGTGLTEDLAQLFRRAVFNLLAGNRDDHLRNHGFVRLPDGWRLSPAFDMNPNRDKHQHALTWDGKTAEPDIDALKATAAYYRIQPEDAQTIIDQVRTAVASWQDKARALQLPGTEIQAMENVFAV